MPTLKEICDTVGGELRGDANIEISGVGSLDGAGPRDIAPLDDENYIERARESSAGAVLLATKLADSFDGNAIVHDRPMFAMNAVIEVLGLAPRAGVEGVHPTALVDAAARIPESARVGAYAVIGPEARIGERCVIHPHVQIEAGVTVGDDTTLDAGCILHEGTVIGARCTIGSCTVIGSQGFGFTKGPNGPVHLIHVGRTVIGDDTHIGALCSIDRARYDDTSIGTMSALDNHVHIAHNCRVGDRTFVAAQVGVAGHGRIGNDCEIGGQAGVGNGVVVHDRVRAGGQSGIISDIEEGATIWGTPATDLRLILRMEAKLRALARKKR